MNLKYGSKGSSGRDMYWSISFIIWGFLWSDETHAVFFETFQVLGCFEKIHVFFYFIFFDYKLAKFQLIQVKTLQLNMRNAICVTDYSDLKFLKFSILTMKSGDIDDLDIDKRQSKTFQKQKLKGDQNLIIS